VNPDLLRQTWAQVGRYGDAVALDFYARLFLEHPEVRHLFGADMSEQRRKITATIGLVVRSGDNLPAVVPILQRLGRDHRRFGAQDEHYTAVGDALLQTLAHFLGDDWTDDVADTWTQAYTTVAQVMIDAAREADRVGDRAHWDARIASARRDMDGQLAIFCLSAPGYPWTPGQRVPIELAGHAGTRLTVRAVNWDRDGHLIVDIPVDPDVPLSLRYAQLRPGTTVRLGVPIDPVDQEER
jgi:hemoglobin-like flavoprotein